MRRGLLTLAVLVAPWVLLGPVAPAYADSDPTRIVVCGSAAAPDGASCVTMAQALTKAHQNVGLYSASSTLLLMPGTYCPLDLTGGNAPNTLDGLTFVGIGLSAYDGLTPPTGPESGLTRFAWSSGCGTEPNAVVTLGTSGSYGIAFQNLTIDGAGGSSVGISALNNNAVSLRDVTVKNLTTGISASITNSNGGVSIASSALVDNGTGLSVTSSGRSVAIDASTIAGNGTGIATSGAALGMLDATITHNTTGISFTNQTGLSSQMVNDVNAGNGTDCAGTGWESGSTNETNLIGPTCTPHSGNTTDITWNNTAIAAAADNGGPTVSVTTPSQAAGTGTAGGCNSTNLGSGAALDQREYKVTGSTCDIGAVQSGASATPLADAYPAVGSNPDFGAVHAGETGGVLFTLSNTGGGRLHVTSVHVSGTGFALSDGCTYQAPVNSKYCQFGVQVHSATPATLTGTLTVNTSTGTLTWPLSVVVLASHGTSATGPASDTITAGTKRTLRTTVTDTTKSAPYAHATVTLQSSPDGGTWTKVTKTTTDSHGKASAKVKPSVNTEYRWSVTGNSGHDAATSDLGYLFVSPVVHVSLTHGSVHLGASVDAYGTLTPANAGATVELQVLESGVWTTVGTATIQKQKLPDHHTKVGYVLPWQPGTTGTWSLRVHYPATDQNADAVSATKKLHVT